MIKDAFPVFKLDTKNTTYMIRVSPFGHLLGEYYGPFIPDDGDYSFSKEKHAVGAGTSTAYSDEKDPNYSLDSYSLELSSSGKGDYKEPSLILTGKDGYLFDPVYVSHETRPYVPNLSLPHPHGELEELLVHLMDKAVGVEIVLHYVVSFEDDVILRATEVIVKEEPIHLFKCASMQFDTIGKDFDLLTLYGGWAFEAQKERVHVAHGCYFVDSKTGNSSNRHNPFFALLEKGCVGEHGSCYMFNLMYSGNHQELVERSSFDKVRIQSGINPFCFDLPLEKGESFYSPLAVLTYSEEGTNGASKNMHRFVRDHVIPHPEVLPPILINNWEATYMKFKEGKIHSIIRHAKAFKIELFALDDGWFGRRSDDTKGLGDYDVNKKKVPHGLSGLASFTEKMGMGFGLWFEPEMANEDSALFEEHPDWVIRSELRDPSKGRHQLVLDLSKKEVCDYIVDNVNRTIEEGHVKYIKWDMNRHMSDVVGGGVASYRYMLGLYSVMYRIISNNPDVYFEGCASGGNRFDLGILSYFNQIWTSDDTDGYERIKIQSGYSLAYPLRCLSNHVSANTSHQALRHTPIDTRINVAMFGAFGFELDLSLLTPLEAKAVKSGMEFYKANRDAIVNGDFYQIKDMEEDGHAVWLTVSKDRSRAVMGYFNGLQQINPKVDEIKLVGLDPDAQYEFSVRPQTNDIKMFGGLINMILPFHVDERGFLINTISKHKGMDGEKESYVLSGKALMSGALKLNQQWEGTGIGDSVRVLGDFGSRVYSIVKVEK